MNVLTTRALAVHYGSTVVLQDVDLALDAGEVACVVGRNGAGKSSLLAALADAVPHHGDVRWEVPRHQVAYVPQRAQPRWDLPLEVRQVVATGRLRGARWWRRPTPQDREVVAEALTRMGLTGVARRPVRELSGGQAQRVLLARALAQQPRVLLLDEPYDGLDEMSAGALCDVLRSLGSEGVAVLAAVHDLGTARSTFARAIALDGRVIADAGPDEVFSASGLRRIFGIEVAA